MHPAALVLITFLGFDPCWTSSTMSTTSSKSGNVFVFSLEWISTSLTVTSKEAVKQKIY